MRKSARNLLIGTGAAAAIVALGYVLVSLVGRRRGPDPQVVLEALAHAQNPRPVAIEYPLDETLFPPDISCPCLRWKDDDAPRTCGWSRSNLPTARTHQLLSWSNRNGGPRRLFGRTSRAGRWRSRPRVTIVGVHRQDPAHVLSAGHVVIRTSADKVEAPLFYREVNLPFVEAVKDPSNDPVAVRDGFVHRDAADRAAEPARVRELPFVLRRRQRPGDGHRLRQRQRLLRHRGSPRVHDPRPERRSSPGATTRETKGSRPSACSPRSLPTAGSWSAPSRTSRSLSPSPTWISRSCSSRSRGFCASTTGRPAPSSRCRGPTTRAWSRATPPGARTGSTSSLPRRRRTSLKRASGRAKVLLSPEDCREFLEEGKPFKFDLYRIPFNGGTGRQARADCRGLVQRHEQFLSPRTRRTASGSSSARRRTTCCSSRTASCTSSPPKAAKPAGCGQHEADELLAQLLAQRQMARLLRQAGRSLTPSCT